MIDLYYWPTPNGFKITIMLEECGLPYKLVPVNIGTGEQFKPDFLKISPNNRMPAIVDHDPPGGGAPVSVFESGAILQYLAEKTGKFLPKDLRGKYEVLQWVNWQMGGLGPMAGQANHFNMYAPQFNPVEQLDLRPAALQQRGQPSVRRAEQAAGRSRRSWPAPIRSPTWRAGRGSWASRISARSSTTSPTSSAGSRSPSASGPRW